MVEIKNTVRFAFPPDSARPSYEEIAKFVKALDISTIEMDTLYRRAETHSVYLKFKTQKAFKQAMENNAHPLRFEYANGTTVVVQASDAEGNFQYVRVCELPPELPDKEISLVLGKYGEVKRVIREKFPAGLGLDIYNGVRGVYMNVKSEIPPVLYFLNWRGNIFYFGNKEKCFICAEKGHQMSACPKKKVQRPNADKEMGEPCTYAGVVKENTSMEIEKVTELEIEVLEEENIASEEICEETQEKEDIPKAKAKPVPIRFWRANGKTYTQYAGIAQISVEDETEPQKKRDLEAKASRSILPPKEKKQRSSSRLSSIGSKSDISD